MSALDPAPCRTLLVGYGKLAARLAPLLLARGEEVIALRRTEGALPDGVRGIAADLAHPLPTSLERVDAVLVTLPPGDTETSYRTALGHLACALPDPPARTVFVSSTGVFEGADPDHPLTEEDEPPRVLHAVDQGPAPLGDVMRFLAARLNAQVPPDSGPAGPRGVVYDGTLLLSLLGGLEHPTYESGYARMVDTA